MSIPEPLELFKHLTAKFRELWRYKPGDIFDHDRFRSHGAHDVEERWKQITLIGAAELLARD